PGFAIVEALWWLVFQPSRWSAMLLNAALVLVAAVLVYRLARSLASWWLALGASLLVVAAPVVQQSSSTSMRDALCFVFAVLVLDATARVAREPSPANLGLVTTWLICALLTKGTAACLVPVPVAALAISGTWRKVRLRWAMNSAGAVLLFGFGW